MDHADYAIREAIAIVKRMAPTATGARQAELLASHLRVNVTAAANYLARLGA